MQAKSVRFGSSLCRAPVFFLHFFTFLSSFSPYIWPLARPNIVEKGAAFVEKLWEGFGKVLENAKLSSRDQVGC